MSSLDAQAFAASLKDEGTMEITMDAPTAAQQALLDDLLNGDGSGTPGGILGQNPPAPAPAPQAQNHPLVDSIRVAILAAKAKGQGIRHLTMCPRDWKVALPYMQRAGPGIARIGPLLVKLGQHASRSTLWVSANDGKLGNMLGEPLSPWFEK